nr:MAG TPA: hypothetical protein [Caudoviricetes sp.]
MNFSLLVICSAPFLISLEHLLDEIIIHQDDRFFKMKTLPVLAYMVKSPIKRTNKNPVRRRQPTDGTGY